MKKIFAFLSILVYFVVYFNSPVFAQNIELVLQTGHSEKINSLAFTPDGKTLASSGNDNKIIFWDVKTWKEFYTIKTEKPVSKVIFSPDNKYIAGLLADNEVKIWEKGSFSKIFTFDDTSGISSILFTPDSNILATTEEKNGIMTLKKWDYKKNVILSSISTETPSSDFIIPSQDGKYFAICQKYVITIYNLISGKELYKIYSVSEQKNDNNVQYQNNNHIVNLNFSEDSDNFVMLDNSGILKIYETSTGKELCTLKEKNSFYSENYKGITLKLSSDKKYLAYVHNGYISDITVLELESGNVIFNGSKIGLGDYFTPDSNQIIIAETFPSIGNLSFVNLKTGKIFPELKKNGFTKLLQGSNSLAFSPDGKYLVSSNMTQIFIYDYETPKEINRLYSYSGKEPFLQFSNNGTSLVSTGASNIDFNRDYKEWDLKTCKVKNIEDQEFSKLFNHEMVPKEYLNAGGESNDMNEIVVWKNSNKREIQRFYGSIISKIIALNGKNNIIAIFEPGNKKSIISLFNIKDGKKICDFETDEFFNTKLSFNDKGNIFAYNKKESINVIELSSGKQIFEIPVKLHHSASFCLSSDLIAVSNEKVIQVWNIKEKRKKANLFTDNMLNYISFSKNGKLLAEFSNGRINLWDLEEIEKILTIEGIYGYFDQILFSEDSKAVSIINNKEIRTYDIKSGKIISSETIKDNFNSVLFSNNESLQANKKQSDEIFAGIRRITKNIIKIYNISREKKDANTRPSTAPVFKIIDTGYLKATLFKFNNSNSLFAAANNDNSVKIYDLKSNKKEITLSGHTDNITMLEFASNDNTIISSGNDKTIRIWDILSGKEIKRFEGHNSSVTFFLLFKNGTELISGSNDGQVKIWDIETRKALNTFETNKPVLSLAINPEGKLLAVKSNDSVVNLYNLQQGELIASLISFDQLEFNSPNEKTDENYSFNNKRNT